MAADEKKKSEILLWCEDKIRKADIGTKFGEFLENEIGATTWEDLTEIYETEDWYELIVDKATKKPLDQVTEAVGQKIPPIPWKRFLGQVEKAKNGISDASSAVCISLH